MVVNEFDVWLDGVVFIEAAGSYEFRVWLDNVPVIEQSGEGGAGITRRRTEIF